VVWAAVAGAADGGVVGRIQTRPIAMPSATAPVPKISQVNAFLTT